MEPLFKLTHYPYQNEGIATAKVFRRMIFGDEPGVGKTAQGIGVVESENLKPCLVICPSTLKKNWQDEIHMWTHSKAMILNNANRYSWWTFINGNPFGIDTRVGYFITNYESLRKFFVHDIPKGKEVSLKDILFLLQIKLFKSVIIDEFHRCKEPTSLQSKLCKGITTGKEYVFGLTGTPIVNQSTDIIPLLSIINRLGDFGGASKAMADIKENPQEFSKRLYETCFIRRLKKDVLTDLPDKTRHIVRIDISNRDEYDMAVRDLKEYLREYKQATDAEIRRKMRIKALYSVGLLKGIAARGKTAPVAELARTIIEAGEKVIIFTHLHETTGELKKLLPGSLTITGEDDYMTRDRNVKAFQNDPSKKVIICSIKAAGVGLTLTASSRVLFNELPWHPADATQGEDRAHRNGQKNAVECIYPLGDNTIDGWLYQIIINKRSVANSITGDEDLIDENHVTEDEIKEQILNLFLSYD